MEIIIGLFILYVIYRVMKGLSQQNKSIDENEFTIRIKTYSSGGYHRSSGSDDGSYMLQDRFMVSMASEHLMQ